MNREKYGFLQGSLRIFTDHRALTITDDNPDSDIQKFVSTVLTVCPECVDVFPNYRGAFSGLRLKMGVSLTQPAVEEIISKMEEKLS